MSDSHATNEYVNGILFNSQMDRVVLISKLRPERLKGFLQPVGGKVEIGETPEQAMTREFREEAGLTLDNWVWLGTLRGEFELDKKIHYFFSSSEEIERVKSMTSERIVICRVDDLNVSIVKDRTRMMIRIAQQKG